MSEKKRNTFYWLFKIFSVLIACALPVWAIVEKFPIWKTVYGKHHSVGVGAILVVIVVLIIFRNAVFNFLKEKLKITHAPPLAVWLILIAISYVLIFIGNFLKDLTIILWMGLIGCAIGTVLTYIAENAFGEKKKEKDNGQN